MAIDTVVVKEPIPNLQGYTLRTVNPKPEDPCPAHTSRTCKVPPSHMPSAATLHARAREASEFLEADAMADDRHDRRSGQRAAGKANRAYFYAYTVRISWRLRRFLLQ